MSNPFKWYVYISVSGEPWKRHLEFPDSQRGEEVAVGKSLMLGSRFGIQAKVIRERRGEEVGR